MTWEGVTHSSGTSAYNRCMASHGDSTLRLPGQPAWNDGGVWLPGQPAWNDGGVWLPRQPAWNDGGVWLPRQPAWNDGGVWLPMDCWLCEMPRTSDFRLHAFYFITMSSA